MMTPWTLRLLVANVAVFILTSTNPALVRYLAFVPAEALQHPWTAVTYMFVHAGFAHIFFNMIGLFFFGPRLEQRLGARDFLILYFISGLGGSLFSFFFQPQAAVIGASGAVYGVLVGFAYFWPRENIYIWGVLPIQARWLALGLIALTLYSGFSGSEAGIAHFAHLGGIAIGFGYLRLRKWRRDRSRQRRLRQFSKAFQEVGKARDDGSVQRWKAIPVDTLHELNRQEVVQLLEKIDEEGAESLSREERRFLDRMAESTAS